VLLLINETKAHGLLKLGIIGLPKPKLKSEQQAENIFVAPPYCQCNVSGSMTQGDELNFFR